MLFRKSIKEEIRTLTNEILNERWQKQIYLLKIESAGILDGREVIFDFLKYNENGCAYEHLVYIISELAMELTFEQRQKMNELAQKLRIENMG